VTQVCGQARAQLGRKLIARHRERGARNVPRVGVSLVDQLPLRLSRTHVRPRLAQPPLIRIALAVRPPTDVARQRPPVQSLRPGRPTRRIYKSREGRNPCCRPRTRPPGRVATPPAMAVARSPPGLSTR